ncbi:flagellar export protein FliJ [Clostridioides mangenotii]|uniref:flagellar export protein FliJ n=1 Tax=Metaclostridioides mangenotii TaxID=1540 RepID=UPI001C10ABAD|nr:flagellar export protein FliJ [Clostridioides mangenotii]MBU5307840.1 flagellar export protein FliJ [Clostridioides mangenotii]MCR1953963.1 flagellar export protein FliJ [Clostridioides mangenotii]
MDKKFKFKLQKVLDIKIDIEKEAEIQLVQSQTKKKDIEEQLINLEKSYHKYMNMQIDGDRVSQKLTRSYITLLDDSIKDTNEKLNKSAKEVETNKHKLIERRIEVKSLEKLKENKYTSYKKEQNLKEQIENDEYAILNFIRRRETV